MTSDSFNRGDSGSLDNTDIAEGGTAEAWTESFGIWAIASNRLSGATDGGICTVEVAANVIVTVTLVSGMVESGIVVRYLDNDNYVACVVDSDADSLKIYETVSGVTAMRASEDAIVASGSALSVTVSGATVTFTDGTTTVTYLLLSNLTAIGVGLYSGADGGVFDDFFVTGP